MKRGQISIFIILGLIISGFIIWYMIGYRENSPLNSLKNIESEIQPIYSHIEKCLEETAQEALFYIGQTGGYSVVPEPNLEEGIAYYLYEGKNYMPSKKIIEDELSDYITIMMPFCVQDFDDNPLFSIDRGTIEVSTTIEDEQIIFHVNYPHSIQKGEKSYSFKNFKEEIPIRLGTMYGAISEFMDKQTAFPHALCINCMHVVSEKYNLRFHVLDTDDPSILLIKIKDERSLLHDEYYFYEFAIKFIGETYETSV